MKRDSTRNAVGRRATVRISSLGSLLLMVATVTCAGIAHAQPAGQGANPAPPPPPATSVGANPVQPPASQPAPQPTSQPGSQPGSQPTCGAEATAQNLTGPARSSYIAECHRRRGDPPREGGTVVSTQRLPSGQPRVGRSRQECRQIAHTRHLWGLARHKFLQRCRYGTSRRTPPPLNR